MSDINNLLGENIRIMAQVITEICQRSTRLQIHEPPISRNQLYILTILDRSGEFLISEFARILNISTAAASKNIDRLEQLGLVARQARPDDRRSLEVRLLDKGRHLVQEVDRITAKKAAPMMAQFTDEEKKVLLDFLRRIVRNILADETNVDLICLQCGGNCGEDCAVGSLQGKCCWHRK